MNVSLKFQEDPRRRVLIREGEMNITSGIWAAYCCAGEAGVHLLRVERADIREEKGRKMPGDGKNGKKRLQKMNVLVICLTFRV